MGEPKFSRPKYDTPSHPWKADRIEEEHAIKDNHGLKNMKEIWKAKSQLRRHRRQAMRLIGNVDTSEGHGKREREDLLRSLHHKGLIESDAELGDILSLSTEDVLNRRLQAQVYYKGFACTMKQARQLVYARSNLHRRPKDHHPFLRCESRRGANSATIPPHR